MTQGGGGRDDAGQAAICWKSEWLPSARRFADEVAVADMHGAASYAEVHAAAAGVARALMADGVGPGDVVATSVPNSRHAVAASFGVALTGAAEAAINPALAEAEIAHCLAVSGARRMVVSAERPVRVAGVAATAVEDAPPVPLAELPEVHVDPASWGRIMFTSGTTGRPKGIVHSHGGRWTANLLLRASLPVAPAPGRAVLLMTPYSHGAGLMTQAFLDGGAAVHLVPGVDVETVAGVLERGEVDQIFAPPTVLAKLVSGLEGRRFGGVSAIFCGTAPLAPELYRAARAMFGPVVRITYGKTEVFNPITVLTPAETDRWYGEPGAGASVCVGWPASGVEVAIGRDGDAADAPDDADATDAPDAPDAADNAAGAAAPAPVLIRARHMLVATLSEAGVAEHPPGAWHRTGDLGFVDAAGRLHLVGREADVIKTGGYRVTPEEIEAALRPALGGGELVVLGLPSDYWGEVIAVAAAGAPADWESRLAPAVASLTRYKRPRLFAAVPGIARNAMGKVVRARVRAAILDAYRFVDGRYPKLEPRAAADGGC